MDNFTHIIDQYIEKYTSYSNHLDVPMIRKAMEFAIKYHDGQMRKSGDPYYIHPLTVADIIASMGLDTDSVVTAVLHDTVEDTSLTLEEIEKHFGKIVAQLVDGVTKLTKLKFMQENVRQAENFRKLLLAMSHDIRVLIVKLADRLHNIRTIEYIKSSEKRHRICLETMEIYAPLAERIGAQKIKIELQDICFSVLNPDARESIIKRFTAIAKDNHHLVKNIVKDIQNLIDSNGVRADVYGRKKTPYSTWMKMKQKNVGLDQLSDIIAFRITVHSLEDCYKTLGFVHSTYQVVPSKFQDFISTPKNNGYQSLHTVVIGPMKQKIEVQIRTHDMHKVAELGVAAHWRYKQNHKDEPDDGKHSWLQELLTILDQNKDPDEFLKNSKLAMYYDQVFCFTPQGNLVALPKGATAVDFAYAVDSDLGNKCIGVKINARIAPLRTQLDNGDQVEIVTAKNQTPSPSWESFVVTGKARSEIRKNVKARQEEEYIILGHNILYATLQNERINDIESALKNASKFFKKTKEELCAAVGEGAITMKEVIDNIAPKKQGLLGNKLSFIKFMQPVKNIKPEKKVLINGLIPGMAIHYAKCCYPLPGDQIIGIIHTGSGVTIHTAQCKMVNNFCVEQDRIIDLAWNNDQSNIPFVSKIKLTISNSPATLAALSATIAKEQSNISNIQIVTRGVDFFELLIDLEVNSVEHVNKIIDILRTQNVIFNVERSNI